MSILKKLDILIAIERAIEVPSPEEAQRKLILEQILDIVMMFKFEICDELTRRRIEDEIYNQFGNDLNVFWTISAHGRPQVRFIGSILLNTTIYCTL